MKKLDVPKIEGVVKKEDFKVERVSITDGYGRVGFYLAICYKGIPLWRTLDSNLDKYKFYLYDPREYAVERSIRSCMCKWLWRFIHLR